MSTISDLNDYTSFLPGPLMPTPVHFHSIPQCGIFSKSKLIICLLSASHTCTHTCTHRLQTQQWLPAALGMTSKAPTQPTRSCVACSGLLWPLSSPPSSFSFLWSHWPLFSYQMPVCHIVPSTGHESKKIPVLGILSPFLLIL